MSKIYYSKEHEWVRVDESDNTVVKIGITAYAQDSLGEIVYVDLPVVGTTLSQNDEAAVLESAKAASDIYAPISGIVLEINTQLQDSPNLINSSPLDEGWMFSMQLSNAKELENMLSATEYDIFLKE